MNSSGSLGKIIPALFATGALVTGMALRQKKIDRLAIAKSRNALEEHRRNFTNLKAQENT